MQFKPRRILIVFLVKPRKPRCILFDSLLNLEIPSIFSGATSISDGILSPNFKSVGQGEIQGDRKDFSCAAFAPPLLTGGAGGLNSNGEQGLDVGPILTSRQMVGKPARNVIRPLAFSCHILLVCGIRLEL